VPRNPVSPSFSKRSLGVARAGMRSVYVIGAVNRSGVFVLKTGGEKMTALKAVAVADGLTGTARASEALITRRQPRTGQVEQIKVDLAKIMARKSRDLRLHPNDILFIPGSGAGKSLRQAVDAATADIKNVIIRW